MFLRLGPLFFAVGFLTPLAAQSLSAANLAPPFGLTPLTAGFLIEMTFAVPAQIRGRWV
jgi:hypothetical protein